MEQPLEVQLPTLVTLATHSLVHSQLFAALMEIGQSLIQFVKVSYVVMVMTHPYAVCYIVQIVLPVIHMFV